MKIFSRSRESMLIAITLVLGFFATTRAAGPKEYRGTMFLTDEPGNWFKNEDSGTPVTIVNVGDRVQFDRNTQTGTKHTVTLLIKPTGSTLEVDQDHAGNGNVGARFDRPGVFLFICKVHPYMTGVVAVRAIRDDDTSIPDVTAQELPFIGHLGVNSLPAGDVLSVLTTIAPDDTTKAAKWDIISPANQLIPAVAGVGEVWVDTQFERVPGQVDDHGFLKPGTITVVNVDSSATPFTVERDINGLAVRPGQWNNPHNMWTNTRLDTVYNTNWFSQTINKIDRASGSILNTIVTGQAPTHIVTIPNEASPQFGILTNPLSAANDIVKVRDRGNLKVVDHFPTGVGRNHPHGHWITADGTKIVVPNVFKGLGVAGSISILDAENGAILTEISHQTLGLESALLAPIAAGIQGNNKAYVSNAVSGQVSVIDLTTRQIIKNIPVTLKPNGQLGGSILDTLQVPIQPPVSPDGRFVGVAVLSLTTVGRAPTGSPDHVAIIDTATDQVVAFLGTVATVDKGAGTHGANWGAKLGGGYYLYVANQFANFMTIIDPDPDANPATADAAVVGRIRLANASVGAGVTDGVGGQGIKPIPNMYDGWIQDTVALSGTGQLSAEVEGWIAQLIPCQRNPSSPGC
ncbi:MAG: hypothetical protein C3F12_13850 [Candidatus Methylomirabilota bacterium]|nr:hypothetical protein [candidate division NC10 bacterium]PWB42980.1 MAG: hypothetical protein C3F12_13850 [candidate division NC10 bacterium]